MDLGCGFGYYGRDLKLLNDKIKLTGVEIFTPYLDSLESWTPHYKFIFNDDIRKRLYLAYTHDLTLMMDVIEHFDKPTATDILDDESMTENKLIISTPLFDYIQGVANSNIHEAHKCFFSEEELREMGFKLLVKIKFPSRNGYIGAFIR